MSNFGKTLHDARDQTSSALNDLSRDAEALSHRGMDAVRDGYEQLREKSLYARDATRTYIHDEPVKSMLIAAAVGVALIGLVALFSELSDRRD